MDRPSIQKPFRACRAFCVVVTGMCLLLGAGCELDPYIMPSRDLDGSSTNASTTATAETSNDDANENSSPASAISYSGLKNIPIGLLDVTNTRNIDIDFDGDGNVDIRISYLPPAPQIRAIPQQAGNATTAPLAAGAAINGGSSWIAGEQVMVNDWLVLIGGSDPMPVGAWGPANNSYMGARFTSGGDTHFGWIRISAEVGMLRIHDWAYETRANVGISAGSR